MFTQDQTGQVNHLYQDTQGFTRLATNKQGATQSTFDYDAFGNALLSSKPNSTIKHRYVGEYLDQDTGFYHLRARDYDPKIGRFMSRDRFEGARNNPLTLNPYLYTHADPVNDADPSGLMSLGNIGVTIEVQSIWSSISISFQYAARAIGRTFVAAATASINGIKNEIKNCQKSRGKKCRIPNLLVIGDEYKEAKKHINDAQTGYGSNGFPISPVVSYRHISESESRKARAYWRSTRECSYNFSKPGQPVDNSVGSRQCDEYPFITTWEGGINRYQSGKVSLRPIKSSDNYLSGQVWGRMVGRGKTRMKDGTKVIVAPYGPFSFYIRDGKFGM